MRQIITFVKRKNNYFINFNLRRLVFCRLISKMRTLVPSTFFCGLLILFSNICAIECDDINETEYFNYIQTVVGHFRVQDGWSSMQHIKMVDDSMTKILSIAQVLHEDLSDHASVIRMYNKIAELVNCRYAEILKTVLFRLTIVANECSSFNQRNAFGHVVYCVVSLQDMLNHSRVLFENLYAALTFLSLIDVKLTSTDYDNFSDYIVDELYNVRNYVSSMETADYLAYVDDDCNPMVEKALGDLESIMTFCLKTTRGLSKIPSDNSKIIIYSTTDINFKLNYKTKYINEYPDFVDFMSHDLKAFMDGAVKNDFTDLGFPELLNPTLTELIPPQKAMTKKKAEKTPLEN